MNNITRDGGGNPIFGQTPTPRWVIAANTSVIHFQWRRKAQERTDRLAFATLAIFPLNPIVIKYQRRTPIQPAVAVAAQIQRYYQTFVDFIPSGVTPDEPVNQLRRSPFVATPSAVAAQIRRYYQPQIFDVAPDEPVDRERVNPYIVAPSAVAASIRRYYAPQIIDPTPDEPIDRERSTPWSTTSSVPNRIGRYYTPIIFDVTPDAPQDRQRPQPFTAAAPSSAYRIGRYYATFPDLANTVTEPTDRALRRAYAIPDSSVASRIRRYYQTLPAPAPDEPANRAQPRGQTRDVIRYANYLRRYYQNAPPEELMGQPGIVTVSFGSGTTTTRFTSTAGTTVMLASA